MRFQTLDSWRGIAAITIVIYHFSPVWGGYLAVDFFFVLSGFILTHVYLGRSSSVGFMAFTGRRLARLYPYHIFTLLVFLGVNLALGRGISSYEDGALATFIQQLTLTQNIGLSPHGLSWNYPSWSVSVEFWVNVLFVLLVSQLTSSIALFAIAVAGLMVIYLNTGHMETQAANYFGFLNSGMVRGVSEFTLGVLTYRVFVGLQDDERWQRYKTAIELTAIAAVFAVLFARDGKLSEMDFLAPFAFMLLVLTFADESGFFSQKMRKLSYLGTISYSIYLNQIIVEMMVWHWVPSLRDQFYTRLFVFLAILLITSHFTFRYIEQPLRRKMLDYFTR